MSDNVSGRKKLDVGTRQRSSQEVTSSSTDMSVYKSSDEGSVRYERSKESSVYNLSSDEFSEYSCDPCNVAGDHLEAEGFCTYCGEYLCGMCFRSHSRGKYTKHHTLLNKDNMPKKQVQTCNPCKTADEEREATGYCENCEEYLCSSCFRSHSRSKATKQHNLMDKNNMPDGSYSAVASSIPTDIHEEGARYPKFEEKYSYIRDINVKAGVDAKDCLIIGMTMLPNNELAIADHNNVSLKLVDLVRNVIKGTLALESVPNGLTTVSKDEVAVSLPNIYVIQIVTVSLTISVQRNIKVMGQCLDIEYRNGKLYASFYKPVRLQILQSSGRVYKTTKPDAEVLKYCRNPHFIAVSPDESLIYMSVFETNQVMCIDMDGNKISMYQHELAMPMDIVMTPFGSVYLCNRNQHVIYKMKPDLSEATVVLGPGDGLHAPQAICFNVVKQHLYISSGSKKSRKRNHIKVFKWQ